MTEEIIIDGVNVAGCKDYDDGTCCNNDVFTLSCEKANCMYKQLKCLEQENKDLKKQIESDKGLITVGGKQQYEYLQRVADLEQENKELKEAQKDLVKRITYFESVLQKAFNCLVRANAEGKITDTLWVTDLTTLWDVFATALRIENIEEYENEVLNEGK